MNVLMVEWIINLLGQRESCTVLLAYLIREEFYSVPVNANSIRLTLKEFQLVLFEFLLQSGTGR